MFQGKQTFLKENVPPPNKQENSYSQQQGLKQIVSLQQKRYALSTMAKKLTTSFPVIHTKPAQRIVFV